MAACLDAIAAEVSPQLRRSHEREEATHLRVLHLEYLLLGGGHRDELDEASSNGGGIASCLLRCGPHDLEFVRILLRRGDRIGKPAICILPCESQHTRSTGPDPDFRCLSFWRALIHHCVIELIVFPTKVDRPLVRETQPKNLECLLQPAY